MALNIHIEGFENVNRRVKEIDAAVDKAGRRAVGKVSTGARAEWARAIASEINLPVTQIKELIRIHPSDRAKIVIQVDSKNVSSLGVGRRVRSLPVIIFGARQSKTGVSFTIKRGQRKKVKSAFIATMPGGHKGVFVRTSKKRLPIKELRTTSVEDVAMDKVPEIQAYADERLKKVFDSQLKYELNGLKK